MDIVYVKMGELYVWKLYNSGVIGGINLLEGVRCSFCVYKIGIGFYLNFLISFMFFKWDFLFIGGESFKEVLVIVLGL